jgi:hypothetical protein
MSHADTRMSHADIAVAPSHADGCRMSHADTLSHELRYRCCMSHADAVA